MASTGVDFGLSASCRGVYVPEVGSSSPKAADPLLVKPHKERGDDDIKGSVGVEVGLALELHQAGG